MCPILYFCRSGCYQPSETSGADSVRTNHPNVFDVGGNSVVFVYSVLASVPAGRETNRRTRKSEKGIGPRVDNSIRQVR
jgi:hypothetical protein